MTDSKMPEPVATVTRVTHGSHQRHYQLQWHKEVNLGAELFIRADLAHTAPVADAELDRLVNDLWHSVASISLTSRAARAITALRARTAQPVGVRVKPLEWRKKAGGFFAEADTGTYRAFAPNGGIHFMWMRYSSWPRSGVILGLSGDTFDTAFPTLESAKAAAQADYEQRILSALLPEGGA